MVSVGPSGSYDLWDFATSSRVELWVVVTVLVGLYGLLSIGMIAAPKGPGEHGFKKAPGPRGWPVFGNMLDLLAPNVHLKFAQYANQYGGIFAIKIPGQRIVVVTDPSLAGTLIGRGSQALPKSEMVYQSSAMVQAFSPTGAHSLISEVTLTPYWKHVRKTLAVAFSVDSTRKRFHDMREGACILARTWNLMLDSKTELSMHMDGWVKRWALDMIGTQGFGVKFGALEGGDEYKAFLEGVDVALTEMVKRNTNPLRVYMHRLLPFTEHARHIRAAQQACYALYDSMCQTIKQRPPPADDDTSIAACIARLRNAAGDGPMDDAHVSANVALQIIAGYDTTATTVCWLLYNIARHPDIQQRLKHELGAAGLMGPTGHELQWEDLTSLPYLQLVIKESMRLHTAAAGNLIRQADRDLVLNGVLVRKGDVVWVPLGAIHNSRHNYLEPERFWPERWERTTSGLQQGTATPAGHAQALKSSFLPFADGPQDCLGQNLAMAVVRTVIITLLSRFWFEVDWDKMGSHQRVEEEQVLNGTLWSKGGIHLKVQRHDLAAGGTQ